MDGCRGGVAIKEDGEEKVVCVYTYVKGRGGGEGKVWKQANQKVLMGSSVRGVFSSRPRLPVRPPSRAKRGPLRWRKSGCRVD